MSAVSRLRRALDASWVRRLSEVLGRMQAVDVFDRAAAMTYYGFLSLFPGLIVFVAVLGVVGSYPETYESIVSTMREAAPGPAVDAIDSGLRDALRNRGTAGGLLGVGLLVALYGSTSAVGAALRAIQAINGVQEGPPWWEGILTRLALTVAVMLTLLVAFTAVVVAGPLFSTFADAAGVDESVEGAISMLRWPLGVAALVVAAMLLYRAGAGDQHRVARLLPGAGAAALLWVVASLGFSLYVSHFSSYDATYGALGTVIVLLIWIWVGNLSLLAGAALNAELERARSQ